MGFINCAAIFLLFLLKIYSCFEVLPSQGCMKLSSPTDRCTVSVYCAEHIDDSYDHYNLQRGYPYNNRNGGTYCAEYIEFNGGHFSKIHLRYSSSRTDQVPPLNQYYNLLIVNLDLSNNGYITVPTLFPMENLNFLNLSSNSLSSATLSNPNDLPSLTEIDLSYNTISSIEIDESQYPYLNLKKLNLSHNYILEIHDLVFDENKKLEILDLSYNFIDSLSISAFEGIKKILDLHLSHNRLSDINRAFFRFSELKNLDLSYNRIQNVKSYDFEKLNMLEKIDLSYNLITSIEPCTFSHMNLLSVINLHGNELSTLNRDTFWNASSLKSVDLSFNQFIDLSKGLFRGKSIEIFFINGNNLKGALSKGVFEGLRQVNELDLSYQNITTLEDYAFLGLDNMNTLLLNNNKMSSMMENCFKGLRNLNVLDLSNNNITDLNLNLEDLVNLNTIVLKNNFLTQIRRDQFDGLSALQFLDLTNNKISKFESNAFHSLEDLINFQISNNPLNGSLEENTFSGLHSLPNLLISYTQLTAIKNGSLIGMLELKELNMSHSKIRELQFNAFIQTGAIETIDLSYNQLSTFHINISDIPHITDLLLNNNMLKYITESTFLGLSRLSKINLAHNKLESVQSKAFNDQNDLRYLDLSFNMDINFDVSLITERISLNNLRLSGIKHGVTFKPVKGGQLSNLEISYSSLTNITEINLKELPHLENIVLSNNQITKLEEGAFKNVTLLRQLDISYNKIYYIQPGVFKDNTHLSVLNVSHNSLTSVSYGVFRGLIYLSTLDMSYNNLTSLESERFHEVQSLSTLIVDHNKIDTINGEEFVGTSLSKLSIGENPLPCELLVNLKKHPLTFAITAIKFNEHNVENVDGVTCNMNGYVYKKASNDSNVSEKLLTDIRELLVRIANKNTDGVQSQTVSSSFDVLRNITDHVDNIVGKIEPNLLSFLNSTSLLTAQNNNTNLLLSKILNTLNKRSMVLTTPFPILKNNNTSDVAILYSKIKEELETSIAIEKDNILEEVDKKITILKGLIQNNRSKTSINPDVGVQDRLFAKKETLENNSSVFTETCVALILAILVCTLLFKFYKSKMFVRTRRSYSTRELPGSMESPSL